MNRPIVRMTDLPLQNKVLVIREDFNVPLDASHITSDARLIAALPTIHLALQNKAAVVLLSHLGRPVEGLWQESLSLAPVALRLSELLQQPVRFERDWLNGVSVNPGEIVLCENIRFNVGETANDPSLAKKLAALGDIYVMDAFATAHRASASTTGAVHHAAQTCAGLLFMQELEALSQALIAPVRPILVIVGGAKISTKLQLLAQLSDTADLILVGGGILNTFMAASGLPIGASLVERNLIPEATAIIKKLHVRGASIPMPTDVVVAKQFARGAIATIKPVADVADDDLILDIGPDTAAAWALLIHTANTIIWNGPVGVFEFPHFAHGTRIIATAIAESHAFSLAGGGDTIAAIEKFGVTRHISYISTGGGAFLEYLEGKTLPAVAALQDAYKAICRN